MFACVCLCACFRYILFAQALDAIKAEVEAEVKYAGYIARQQLEVDRLRRMEGRALPLDLDKIAIRLDLNAARTEHRLASADGLERLRVNMPVTGSYAQVRRFIAAALAHDPALSLDAVKLRRASPMAAEVEAELQWSLHGRAAP